MQALHEEIGIKGLARVLTKSLDAGGEFDFIGDDPIHRQEIVTGLSSYPKKTIGSIFKSIGKRSSDKTHQMEFLNVIEDETPGIFTRYVALNIFGCPRSTDIDLVAWVDNIHLPLSSSEKTRMIDDLFSLGYDPAKTIDLNLISIDANGIISFKKGGKELSNILINTYDLHPQKYPLILTEPVTVSMEDKVSALVKYILDNLKFLVPSEKYAQMRAGKIAVYDGGYSRINFAVDAYAHFIKDAREWDVEVWKSLVVKYIQLIMLYTGIYDENVENTKLYFQKDGMVTLLKMYLAKYHPTKAYDLTLVEKILHKTPLHAGQDVPYDTAIIDLLHNRFGEIVAETFKSLDWSIQKIDLAAVGNPTALSTKLFDLYMANPLRVTDEFCEEWVRSFGDDRIDYRFQEEIEGADTLERFHPDVAHNTLFIKQRSSVWKDALKFYACGKNTGVKSLPQTLSAESRIKERSNLLMGCVGESIVTKGYDFSEIPGLPNPNPSGVSSGYEFCTVGMIVDQIGVEGSTGSCPDGLLVSSQTIIPIEIKTINGSPKDNAHYFRSFSLAKRQVQGCSDIINRSKPGTSTHGIVVLCWIYEEGGAWHYDCYGGVIPTSK